MTSSDREILIAIQVEQTEQGKRIARIESRLDEQDARLTRMEQRQEMFMSELQHTADKIDWIQHTIYWGFAILAIVVAYCTISPKHKTDEKPATSPVTIYTGYPPENMRAFTDSAMKNN